jgi:hypothetical protein
LRHDPFTSLIKRLLARRVITLQDAGNAEVLPFLQHPRKAPRHTVPSPCTRKRPRGPGRGGAGPFGGPAGPDGVTAACSRAARRGPLFEAPTGGRVWAAKAAGPQSGAGAPARPRSAPLAPAPFSRYVRAPTRSSQRFLKITKFDGESRGERNLPRSGPFP